MNYIKSGGSFQNSVYEEENW